MVIICAWCNRYIRGEEPTEEEINHEMSRLAHGTCSACRARPCGEAFVGESTDCVEFEEGVLARVHCADSCGPIMCFRPVEIRKETIH